jgi:hypothetical protein
MKKSIKTESKAPVHDPVASAYSSFGIKQTLTTAPDQNNRRTGKDGNSRNVYSRARQHSKTGKTSSRTSFGIGNQKLSAYERSKMRQLQKNRPVTANRNPSNSSRLKNSDVRESNISHSLVDDLTEDDFQIKVSMRQRPGTPKEESEDNIPFSYSKSNFKGRKIDRSLRYDPEASPTKNLTASKKD